MPAQPRPKVLVVCVGVGDGELDELVEVLVLVDVLVVVEVLVEVGVGVLVGVGVGVGVGDEVLEPQDTVKLT